MSPGPDLHYGSLDGLQHIEDIVYVRRAIASGRAGQVRTRLGITTHDIGRAIGVDPSSVTKWENGTNRPSRKYVSAYAALLRQMDDMLAEEGES